MHCPTFKSDFAILDVKHGRAALEKRIAKSGPIRIRAVMTIDYVSGNDDGISQEFSCSVLSLREFVR